MPEIGEIRRGKDIGKKYNGRFIWQACEVCGKKRWVTFVNGKPISTRCVPCFNHTRLGKSYPLLRGERSATWKGGKCIRSDGYKFVRVYPDNFFYPMADVNGCILEHRLVVAKALNRCLLSWEIVHHKGVKYPMGSKENRADNRYPENLQLLNDKKYHLIDSLVKTHINQQEKLIKELQNRVTLLEAELVLLKKEMNYANHN